MPRIRVDSITILPNYATLNGSVVSSDASVPQQPFNIPVSKDEVYARTYEAGNEYDMGVTPVGVRTAANPAAEQQLTPQTVSAPEGSTRA